jgi:hypothetical protein
LEDTDDDEVLTRFLAGVRRCWLRAHFVVVFPERRNPTRRDDKCEYPGSDRFAWNTVNSDLVFSWFSLSLSCQIARSYFDLCFLSYSRQFISHRNIRRYVLTGWSCSTQKYLLRVVQRALPPSSVLTDRAIVGRSIYPI